MGALTRPNIRIAYGRHPGRSPIDLGSGEIRWCLCSVPEKSAGDLAYSRTL